MLTTRYLESISRASYEALCRCSYHIYASPPSTINVVAASYLFLNDGPYSSNIIAYKRASFEIWLDSSEMNVEYGAVNSKH